MISSGIFFAALLGAAHAAADRACLAVEGEQITARDLAPAWEALRGLPGDTTFGYAPAPGARRIFYLPELERQAARHEVPPPAVPICVERAMEELGAERLLAALRSALELPAASIEILEYSRYPAPHGELEFLRSGLALPPVARPDTPVLWKGCLRYAGSRRFVVWARVRITATLERVVAAEPLPPGQPVRAEQLKTETYTGSPLVRTVAAAPIQVVGKAPRHLIPAGAPVPLSLLAEPHAVNRGDEVAIEVDTGAARLAFTGRAESAGHRGETVSVRNLSSGKTFRARVAERGRVTVKPTKPLDKAQTSGDSQ